MKRLVNTIAVITIALFCGSCQQESLDAYKGSAVTFTVEVPAAAATKGVENGENINNLVYAVYKTTAETLEAAQNSISKDNLVYQINPKAKGESTAFSEEGKTNVTIELVNDQNYIVLFWAQVDQTWVSGENFDLTNVTYPQVENKNSLVANNDVYSAFSGRAFIKNINGSYRESVSLDRPFAQLNIASTDPDDYDVNVTYSSVKVCDAAASFNVASQSASAARTEVEYTRAVNPSGEFSTKYPHFIASNYLFANGTIKVEYTIETEAHGTIVNYDSPITNVPVAKNYRTNVLGGLLTSNVYYEVTLEKNWNEPAKEAHPLYVAAAIGGEFTLEDNVDLTQEAAPLIVTSDLTLNLNGKTLTGGKVYDAAAGMTGVDIAAISVENGATLTIVGEGKVAGSTYGVYAKNGTLNIEGGSYEAETSAVQVGAATVNIKGGTFSNSDQDKRYTINCLDGNWKNGTAKVFITGGTFIGFNPANNPAEGAGTNFCAEGYTAYEYEAGKYRVVEVVAVLDNDELKAAVKSGGFIELTDDIQILETLDIKLGVDVHLDLNGKKITIDASNFPANNGSQYAFIIREGGSLVIDGNGTVETTTPAPIMFYPGGDLVIESGTFIRHIPEGYNGSVGSMFVGTRPAGGWETTCVTINGGYFDPGYYNQDAADIEDILAGMKALVETESDIQNRGKSADKNKLRVAIKDNVMKTFNKSYNDFNIWGGTFVGANPAWGDEGMMLPTKPYYLRPWTGDQGSLIEGQVQHDDGIVLPEGFTITKGVHEDGRPTYTVTYTKPESEQEN